MHGVVHAVRSLSADQGWPPLSHWLSGSRPRLTARAGPCCRPSPPFGGQGRPCPSPTPPLQPECPPVCPPELLQVGVGVCCVPSGSCPSGSVSGELSHSLPCLGLSHSPAVRLPFQSWPPDASGFCRLRAGHRHNPEDTSAFTAFRILPEPSAPAPQSTRSFPSQLCNLSHS